ncbi:MAG: rubrerythrin family protein [Deltaproteobacteria bacterium]|nr:rubrerythrin family protein [Deltaproteobacteria bacterium]
MKKTEKNLLDAFAGESKTSRKYLAYAQQAEREGYTQAAKLFKAASAAEAIHALAHLRLLGMVKSTAENLEDAISGETHTFTTVYPTMIREAEEEGQKAAAITMGFAAEVECSHARLYRKVLSDLENLPGADYYVCAVCGYTVENQVPDTCPVCKSSSKAFFQIE